MKLTDFLKTTEATVVLAGLLMTVLFGKFWAIVTAVAYVFVNLPNLWRFIMAWLDERL